MIPALSFAALLLAATSACRQADPVLAEVGPARVRASVFTKEVARVPFTSQAYLRSLPGRRELLKLLIRRKMILSAAESVPPDADLTRALAELKARRNAERKALDEKFQENRERLWVSFYMGSLKSPGGPLHVSDDDIRKAWETEFEVRASHILVSRRALAEELSARLARGEPFQALAKAHSEDPGSSAKGGDTGYLLRGSLVPEFEEALFALKNGETSGIVITPYGFHLIRRTADRRLSATPLNDAGKERLRQALASRRLEIWVQEQRTRTRIREHWDALAELPLPEPPAP